jgi:segregation and condensation protein B
MLNRGKPHRVSRPMIETLAIIAYRQPIARSEIESIRGVSVGHVIKALMEMQLVRIVGRSDLPGRPFLFGTTTTFLDHFGLKSLNDLNAMQPGVERTPPSEQRAKHIKHRPKPAADTSDGAPTDAPAAVAVAAPPATAPTADLFTISADVPAEGT